MELGDLVGVLILGTAAYSLGVNERTFKETKEWLNTHNIDLSWNRKQWEDSKSSSKRALIDYYIGYPGRFIAYKLYSKKR
jgi:hypothetical protein